MGFIAKAYSNKELAELYGVSYHCWLKWLKPIKEKQELGININGLWNTSQVEKIVAHLGPPSKEIFD